MITVDYSNYSTLSKALSSLEWKPDRCAGYLLKVVDHEEDVWVAHLGFLTLAVHRVLTGRSEHLLHSKE